MQVVQNFQRHNINNKKNSIFSKISSSADLNSAQCDQIWRNYATSVKFCKSLAIFEGLFNIWQNCAPTFVTFYAFGQKLIIVKGQKL